MNKKNGKTSLQFWRVELVPSDKRLEMLNIKVPYFLKWRLSEEFPKNEKMSGEDVKNAIKKIRSSCKKDLIGVRTPYYLVDALAGIITALLFEKEQVIAETGKYKVKKIARI